MDTDAFVQARKPSWERLQVLTKQRKLNGDEADELITRYQSAAADFAQMNSRAGDPDVILGLSSVIANARWKISGTRVLRLQDFTRFFTIVLPLALYRIRWLTIATAVVFIAIGVANAWWIISNPEVQAQLGSERDLKQYAQEAFEAYYSNYPAPDFAAQVWTNNARIAVMGVATGITGIFPLYLLVANAGGVGVAGAIMYLYSDLGVFFGLILPHGFLELWAIFVSIAAGLRLFWALLVPGKNSRTVALARAGRQLGIISVGLIILLAISGVEEGFLTPSGLPVWLKVTIGGLVLLLFLAYVHIWGRFVAKSGETGDLSEDEAGYTLVEAA
ncbi:MAG: stage II sporulation protein M [Actinomycetaceae bacterium]|nr:stage II sporulation protein M [Actinomycetaceae bacterium]